MKHITAQIALFSVLLVLLFSGCKDFWHPEGSQLGNSGNNNKPNDNNPGNNPSGGNNPGGNDSAVATINLAYNEYDNGWNWQKVYESSSLFSDKITQGDEYTFSYTFKSNVAVDYVNVILVDTTPAAHYWTQLSNNVTLIRNIAANTQVHGIVTITAIEGATSAINAANTMVFQSGNGTVSSPTLTFTSFNVVKTKNGSGESRDKTNWFMRDDADGTLACSVGADEVITVNVNKTSEMDVCSVGYPYSGEKNKTYIYKFEAWTKSGTRDVRVCVGTVKMPSYLNYPNDLYYPNTVITLDTTRQPFELECSTDGEGEWVNFALSFNCGGEIGELYIKIVSIDLKE